jgi:hypothetical protein
MELPASGNLFGFRKMILLLIIAGSIALFISPVSAETGVSISAEGVQSYYLGEEVVLRGFNYDSESTYLFITGPGISPDGGKLSSPLQNVSSGNPGSFDKVLTKPDKTWEYTLYTYNLGINPGPYVIYAVSQPKTADLLTSVENKSVRLIFKNPFITAKITPPAIIKGQAFTVTGSAEGNPETVQLWIIGDNFAYTTAVPPGPDSMYALTISPEISGTIPKGQCYLIVQHPMQNNKLDLVVSGDWVKNLQLTSGSSSGTNLFKITGTGSLQGRDAVEALIAGLNDPVVDDTYTIVPFSVEDSSGSVTIQTPAAAATPAGQQTPASPLQYAPIGALVLIGGIFIWSRR